MPVETLVTENKYYNQITNGKSTKGNTTNYANFLLGSIGSFFGRRTQVKVTAFIRFSPDSYTMYNSGTKGYIKGANNYLESGISVGDLVTVCYAWGNAGTYFYSQYNHVIESLNENLIVFESNIIVNPLGGDPDSYLGAGFPCFVFNKQDGQQVYKSVIIGEGLVPNDGQPEYENITTGEDQYWFNKDFVADDLLDYLGVSKSWVYKDDFNFTRIRSEYDGDGLYSIDMGTNDDNGNLGVIDVDGVSSLLTYRFEKRLIGFYTEAAKTNLYNRTPFEELKGDKTYKQVVRAELRKSYGDQNGTALSVLDDELGSIGDFGESLNGFQSEFSISQYTITDLFGDPIDRVDVAGCEVTIRVVSSGSLSPNKIFLTHQQMSDETSYLNDKRFLNENLRFSQQGGQTGFSNSGINETITDYAVTQISTSEIEITATIKPNQGLNPLDTDIKATFEKEYLLYVVVGDGDQDAEDCGITSLIVDVNNYQENTDIEGLVEVDSIEFRAITSQYYTDMSNAEGDPVNVRCNFRTAVDLGAEIVGCKVNWIGYNPLDEEDFFVIKENNIVFESDIINGLQEIALDTTRGFDAFFEGFNVVKLNNLNYVDPWNEYELEYSTKVPFRENVDISENMTQEQKDLFYDKTKPLNGLNQKASQYAGVNGYEVRVSVQLIMRSQEVDTEYNLICGDPLRVFDYHLIIT